MKYTYVILILTVTMGLYSCQGSKGENGDPYPIKSHIISGYVNEILSGPKPISLRTEHHVPLYSVTGGALVRIENTNLQALTNDKGYFTITGVPTGVYNVVVSKDGYGEQKFFGVNIQDDNALYGGMYGNPYYGLAQKCKIELEAIDLFYNSDISFFQIINSTKNFFESGTNYSYGIPYQNWKYFFSTDSSVNFNNYQYDGDGLSFSSKTYFDYYEYSLKRGFVSDSNVVVEISNASILYNHFNSGDTIYVVGYGVNYYKSHGDYFDYDKNKRVYTSLNPKRSNVVSFVLP